MAVDFSPRCQCQGEHCDDHVPGQPCPNDAATHISYAMDTPAGTKATSHTIDLCEACAEAENALPG
jgi:hypothetical protein